MRLFRKRVTIEAQLAALAKAGLVVNAGVVATDLTTFAARDDLERKPFGGLVETLGIELEREPFTPICDRLWMCDFECIEGHGAYCDVLERLERMTGRALSLSGITDHVDVEAGKAWVEFTLRGDRTRWNLRVDDDWLDPQVLASYDALLKTAGSAVRLHMNQHDYGQVAFLGAFSPEEKVAFDRLTRIKLPLLAGQLR